MSIDTRFTEYMYYIVYSMHSRYMKKLLMNKTQISK